MFWQLALLVAVLQDPEPTARKKSRTVAGHFASQHHTEPPPLANDNMSPTQDTVKVAAIQAAPVAFDLPKSLIKVAHFTVEAAKAGADLVVFP